MKSRQIKKKRAEIIATRRHLWRRLKGARAPLASLGLFSFISACIPRWMFLDLFGRPLGKFTEPANFDEDRARMGSGSEAET